jgi:hypothetical protein
VTTPANIKAAAEGLADTERQELFWFLAASLRRDRIKAPEPRQFSAETIQSWIADDEAGFECLRRGP